MECKTGSSCGLALSSPTFHPPPPPGTRCSGELRASSRFQEEEGEGGRNKVRREKMGGEGRVRAGR